MAKANSVVQIEGSIDNLTFFKKDGKNFVRRKSEVSKERIATDPNYVRTRENNSEFSLCTAAAKALRMALGSMVFKSKDNKLSSRMLQTMYRVKSFDTVSVRGKRSIAIGLSTAMGKLELTGFDFNKNARLNSVLFAPYELDVLTGKLTIANLLPLEQLIYPQGATHVSFQSAVLAINFATDASELVLSPVENVPLDLTAVTLVLTPSSLPASTGVTLFLISILFYQEVNGVQYSLKNEEFNVLNVLDVI